MVQAAENVRTRFPGFRYGVFSIEGGEMDMSLYRDIGSNEPASVLAPRSSSLSDKVAFYVIGRDLALGLDQAQQLPDAVKILRQQFTKTPKRNLKNICGKDTGTRMLF